MTATAKTTAPTLRRQREGWGTRNDNIKGDDNGNSDDNADGSGGAISAGDSIFLRRFRGWRNALLLVMVV
jgi:hypothetical protein